MIRDRKMKKWQGFMMPEHIRALKILELESQKIEMPLLDEYQLQEFDERIHYSMDYHFPVEFTFLIEGFEHKIVGYVHYFDQLKRQINVKTLDGPGEYINFDNIMNVKVID
jgi:hypothetical protein